MTTTEKGQKIREAFWSPDSYLSLTIMDKYSETKNGTEVNGLSLEAFLIAGSELLTDYDFEMAEEMQGF